MNKTPLPTELEERFGKPTEAVVLSDGATAWAWEVDPSGKGVAVARSVASAVDCVLLQIDAMIDYAARHDLKIRQLVAPI